MGKKICYIIPLHKKSDLVFRAIESVPTDAEVIVSMPPDIAKQMMPAIDKFIEGRAIGVQNNISVFDDATGSSYPTLVNRALRHLQNHPTVFDYINILEYDDVILPNAHKAIDMYGTAWKSAEILAPLAYIVKYNDEDPSKPPILMGVANEASMAPQMAEEFGYVDFNMMLRTNFMFVNGCYIKPEVFKAYGMFKENFEVFYDYEWALRVVYNGGVVRSVPRATHFHTLTNDGAFETHKALPNKTRENWLVAAKREYFFDEDRKIKFDNEG